jgi:hypothetical protein
MSAAQLCDALDWSRPNTIRTAAGREWYTSACEPGRASRTDLNRQHASGPGNGAKALAHEIGVVAHLQSGQQCSASKMPRANLTRIAKDTCLLIFVTMQLHHLRRGQPSFAPDTYSKLAKGVMDNSRQQGKSLHRGHRPVHRSVTQTKVAACLGEINFPCTSARPARTGTRPRNSNVNCQEIYAAISRREEKSADQENYQKAADNAGQP